MNFISKLIARIRARFSRNGAGKGVYNATCAGIAGAMQVRPQAKYKIEKQLVRD